VEYTDLVCGMNVDLIDAMLDALGAAGTHARLAPAPGRCCVTIDAPPATAEGSAARQ
jgi:predicted ArsR family transcriptional regulator